MSTEPQKPLTPAELIKKGAEERRRAAERKGQAEQTVRTVFDEIIKSFDAKIQEYVSDPYIKAETDSLAAKEEKPTTPLNYILNQLVYAEILASKEAMPQSTADEIENRNVAIAAFKGLKNIKGIAAKDIIGDVVHVNAYLTSPDNKTHTQAALTEKLKEVAVKHGLLKSSGANKTPSEPIKPVAAPAAPQVTASSKWLEDPDAPAAAPAATAQPEPAFPDFTGGSTGKSGFPDFRSAQEVEIEAKKLFADAQIINAVCKTALKDKVAENYSNLDRPSNVAFLTQLEKVTATTVSNINAAMSSATPKSITVTESSKKLWAAVTDTETKRLKESLIKFEGAEFAIKKAKIPSSLKSKLADDMRKTFTEECAIPTAAEPKKEINLEALDEALTAPTLLQKHGQKLGIGSVVATLALAIGGGVILAPRTANDPKPQPDNGAMVARNDPPPKPVIPPKVELPKAELPKVEPKEVKPKTEEPKEPKAAMPKPEEFGPPKPVEPPKVDAPKVAKPEDNPVGKKTNELKTLFERSVINDFVVANPDVVTHGFIREKDGVFTVSDNVKISYMPIDDVTRGVWVLNNERAGKIFISPPANKRLDIGLVANAPNQKKAVTSYHLSQINGGKEIILKDQMGEAMNFSLPSHITPNKFMTGQELQEMNSPSIEFGAHYTGGKGELQTIQRVDGVESPIMHLGINVSGIPIVIHSGIAVDQRGSKLDFLTRGGSTSVRSKSMSAGSGDPSDAYLIFAKNKQEPLIVTEKYTNYYNLGSAPIVAGLNGGWDTPNLKFRGFALPVPHRTVLPVGDKRPPTYRDVVSNVEGGGTLYLLPKKDVSFRVARGNDNPVSFTEGGPVANTQVLNIKAFIAETKDTLYPENGKIFTFNDYATQAVRANRELAQIKWAGLEPGRAHSNVMPNLEPGAFGPAKGPQMARPGLREGETATRYSTDSNTLKDETESKTHSWLDEHKRAAQGLLDRASDPVELGRTKKAAGEKFKDAELLLKDIIKLKDDDENKTKKLNELYDLEAEAARLLGVPFPDPLKDGADDKAKQAHAKEMTAARTLMRNLLTKTPAAILQNRMEAELQKEADPRTPLFKTTDDPELDNGAMLMPKNADGSMLAQLEERKGLPTRKNPIRDFVDGHRDMASHAKSSIEKDAIARHRDRSMGKNDKPWEIG